MKMYHKYVNEFVLGQGYVQQPPVVMSEEEVNAEIEAQGGQKYQNVFYVEVAAEQCVEADVLARCAKCNALIETTVHCDNCGTFEPTRR